MKQYHDLLQHVLTNGRKKEDRTGTGTMSLFGAQMRFDLRNGAFPVVTTKKIHLKSVIHELLWFIKGDTNIRYLKENGVRIWDEWADAEGNLGPVYGKQWREWEYPSYVGAAEDMHIEVDYIDQLADAIKTLRTNPDSRRIIVSAWNPGDIPSMKLPPCHALFQFFSRELSLSERIAILNRRGKELWGSRDPMLVEGALASEGIPKRALSCQLYQRSADLFLGVPFNIASYALLTHMVAHVTNHVAEEFVWTGGDCHIYLNHFDQVAQQLSRTPFLEPEVVLDLRVKEIDDFTFDSIEVIGYQHHPAISAPVAV